MWSYGNAPMDCGRFAVPRERLDCSALLPDSQGRFGYFYAHFLRRSRQRNTESRNTAFVFSKFCFCCYLKNDFGNFYFGIKICRNSVDFEMVSTNATFSVDYVQDLIARLSGNVVLVVDEAHNFGAENLSQTLLPHIPYRLALSATIDRHGDPEGTQKLYDYFGEKCIEYTLKDAIENDMLSPYYYHPVSVSLNEEELGNYLDLTNKIRKNVHADKDGKVKLSEYAKMLLIKRARIVAGATEKIATLRHLMEDYRDDNQILVYCGATTMHDVDYQEGKPPIDEARQIDIVAGMLGNDLGMRVTKFTSEENAEERERIKADFAEGTHLQALVAIRCLDAVSGKNRQAMELIAYAEAIREWLAETYKEKELTIREDLETKVNEIFERMYHGHRRVAIDAKYHVELLTTISDREIAAGESEGSNRVKNFAFIAGLVALAKGKIVTDNSENGINLSSEPYPLVMDAPFSNADETHTANISKVLPEIAEQVIMFVMQKDWNYAEPVMNDRVGQRYHLDKISETLTRLN